MKKEKIIFFSSSTIEGMVLEALEPIIFELFSASETLCKIAVKDFGYTKENASKLVEEAMTLSSQMYKEGRKSGRIVCGFKESSENEISVVDFEEE